MGLDLIAFHVEGNYLLFILMPFHYVVHLFLSSCWPPQSNLQISLRRQIPEITMGKIVWLFSLLQFDFLEANFLFVCFWSSRCVWLVSSLIFCLLVFGTCVAATGSAYRSLGFYIIPPFKRTIPEAFPIKKKCLNRAITFPSKQRDFQNFHENFCIFSLLFAVQKTLRIKILKI